MVPLGHSQNNSNSSLEDGLLLLVDPCGHQAVDLRSARVGSSKPSWPCLISSSRPRSCSMRSTSPAAWKRSSLKQIQDMRCSFCGAFNCWNSAERKALVCLLDVIYSFVLHASDQPCAGTSAAAAHGICSDGRQGASITMCHSRARWCPTAKNSSDRKGKRRATKTAEFDGHPKKL